MFAEKRDITAGFFRALPDPLFSRLETTNSSLTAPLCAGLKGGTTTCDAKSLTSLGVRSQRRQKESIRQSYVEFISRNIVGYIVNEGREEAALLRRSSSTRARITVDQSTSTIHPSCAGSYLRRLSIMPIALPPSAPPPSPAP